ncbi:hypothetical protein BWI17_16750 [Betaproteobacteria bacterium GR16-43]|nr:hypothetical protein BWI17_16750 [Betaproteobacteria bacterium GR16-43]
MSARANSRIPAALGATLLFAALAAHAQVPAPPTYPDKPPEGLKPQVNEDEPQPPDPKPGEVIQKRPGSYSEPLRFKPPLAESYQLPGPTRNAPRESPPVPDRWRIMQALGFKFPAYDPYNQNILKGDLPLWNDPWLKEHLPWVAEKLKPDWFFSLTAISDSLVELRRLPTPVAPQTSVRPNSVDIFGQGKQQVFVETLIFEMAAIKGNTTFRPPDYEIRITPAIQYNRAEVDENRALRIDPRQGTTRDDNHVGLQTAFVDVHLRNVSDRYDFDSIRVGIQPITSDFRGFLLNDVPMGIRYFGIRDNNHVQFNVGWFRKMEKDTNSGLNDPWTKMRKDETYLANYYRQDFPFVGFTSQGLAAVNINREGTEGNYFNNNGFIERPAALGDERGRNYTVGYLGYTGDGHLRNFPGGFLDRWNLSTSLYLALGHEDHNSLAGQGQKIRAGFAAAEFSRDFSWMRLRLSALVQSGDKDPFDNKATGFDAIFENPLFAGADTSFWIRQSVPLIGGGGVALSARNGVLASLRTSKEEGQSNFVNPGLLLLGVGVDADVLPQLRAVGNVNYLRFQDTTVLGVLRNQAPPDREIGWDVSGAIQYRPFMSQNVVLNASAAVLVPGKGLKQLYDEDKRGPQYSILFNLLLTY